jgi:hypothetical protein
MRHGRQDYDSIQDTDGSANIHPDEPVFLIRAQDVLSGHIVRMWATYAAENGVDSRMVKSAMNQSRLMDKWSAKKIPDIPAPVDPLAVIEQRGPVRETWKVGDLVDTPQGLAIIEIVDHDNERFTLKYGDTVGDAVVHNYPYYLMRRPQCDHKQWDMKKHGRRCPCGVLMCNPGD